MAAQGNVQRQDPPWIPHPCRLSFYLGSLATPRSNVAAPNLSRPIKSHTHCVLSHGPR